MSSTEIINVFLSRRNLEALLAKLDHNKSDPAVPSACTIIKRDDSHTVYPQSIPVVVVTAVEDGDYYIDRSPGPIADLTAMTPQCTRNT